MASDWPEASEAAMAAQDALDDAAWFGGELMARDARIAALEAENTRLTAQLAERDAEIKTLVVRVAVLERAVEKAADWHSLPAHEFEGRWGNGWQDTSDGDDLIASDLRAALAARGGEV